MKQQIDRKKQTEQKASAHTAKLPKVSWASSHSLIQLLQHTFGNHGMLSRCPNGIPTKLKIGKPRDKYELEANRVAEQIIRMPEPSAAAGSSVQYHVDPLSVQQSCSNCEKDLRRQRREEEEACLQAKKNPDDTPQVLPKLENQLNILRSRGQPLSESARAFFEPRFGYDFRNVRIHTDTRASEMARILNARAFTVGHDVVFEGGQFVPGSRDGKRLLAHELAHVTQQQQGHISTPDVQCNWREIRQWYEDYLSTALDIGTIGYGYLCFGLDNRASAHLIHNIIGSGQDVTVPTDFIFSSPSVGFLL